MKFLICKHAPQEGIGYFEGLIREADIDFDYQELYCDPKARDLTDYQALIIMGGPMNVYQQQEYPFLRTDYLYLETALKLNLPVLGFCLGAQLAAMALGAKVYRNPQPELGWYELDLLAKDALLLRGFPERFPVFQWHGDTFELPNGAIRLASSPQCQNQAFAWQDRVFGIQFHLEVTAAQIAEWLQDEATLTEWGFSAPPVLQDTTKYLVTATELGRNLFQNFLAII